MAKINGLIKKVLCLVTLICMLAAFITVPASAEVMDGAADLLYFNDFSDINTISFEDRGAEKTTYGKIDADIEGGHSSIYKHYMQTGTSRTTYMTSTLPMGKTVSGKKLGISFQLKYDVTDLANFQPTFYLKSSHDTSIDTATLTDDTLFHIISGGLGYYYVGGAKQQRYKFNGSTELKLEEWNRFDIEIDQTASPMTGKVYANGVLCAEVTYPAAATFSSIEKLVISSLAYDKSLENATSSWLVSQAPMVDNLKVYEIDENDTFGFVASETKDDAIYAELGGTVAEIPSGFTFKKVGSNNAVAINAELVKGHMIKFDTSGLTLDAGAEYMIQAPNGITDMYGRSFDDVLLFNAPAGEANIYYNKFDSTDGIIAVDSRNTDIRVIEETIEGHGNVLEVYSTSEVNNLSNTPWSWKAFDLGRTIDSNSGKIKLSFDFMFNLPVDENTDTTQLFYLDVYPANIDAQGNVTYASQALFKLLPGGATWILRSFGTDGNKQWRPNVTDYALTTKYHTIKFEIDKSNNTALFYSDDTSITGTTPYTLATALQGSFNALMFSMQADAGNNKGDCDSFTTRIDNLRVWEEAAAMDLRVVNMDNTEVLPETEIPNAVKGFKAYFDGAATPVVSLKNNTDNEVVTVNVTSNAAGTEHTIALTEFLDAGDSYTLSVGSHKYSFTTSDSGMVISGFGIYKANGEQVDEFSDVTVGETLKAKATIYNGGGKNICISYGIFGGKFMKAFDFTQYTNIVAGISGTPVEIDIPVTADLAADELSVYLWNDLNSLTPYIQCVEID